MKYGQGFWVVRAGERISLRGSPHCYPATRGFEYCDGTGDRGEFLLEDFTVDYAPRWAAPGTALRMTVCGDPAPVLHQNAFDFDFASVPRALRWAACDKADYRIRVASLFHDILCCVHHDRFPIRETNLCLVDIMEAFSGGTPADFLLRRKVAAAVAIGLPFVWHKSPDELRVYRRLFSLSVIPL